MCTSRNDRKSSHFYVSDSRYPEVEIPDELKDPSPSIETSKAKSNASRIKEASIEVKIAAIQEVNQSSAMVGEGKLVEAESLNAGTAGSVKDTTAENISAISSIVLNPESLTFIEDAKIVTSEN